MLPRLAPERHDASLLDAELGAVAQRFAVQVGGRPAARSGLAHARCADERPVCVHEQGQ
jgi:hypothetical protein